MITALLIIPHILGLFQCNIFKARLSEGKKKRLNNFHYVQKTLGLVILIIIIQFIDIYYISSKKIYFMNAIIYSFPIPYTSLNMRKEFLIITNFLPQPFKE